MEWKLLSEKQAIMFHIGVMYILLIGTHAKRDLRTEVVFVTTRVKNPYEDNWVKLCRIMIFLKRTPILHRKLEIIRVNMVH